MMLQLPIGVSNFKELVTEIDFTGEHYLFVDKSLFIRDILGNASKVILLTRPRRFGKTLNMSMLHHFLSAEVDGEATTGLFDNLKIAAHPEYMQHQGQYPVIYLTLKDIKSNNFAEAYESLKYQISILYMQFKELLFANPKIGEDERNFYQEVIEGKANLAAIKNSLKRLSEHLHNVFAKKVIVLIDEYDTPIQTAYVHKYYDEMINFMREFLGTSLKDNSYLQKAVLTGILRVSKESLFSGLNHIKAYSLLDSTYGEYFGFTEAEVTELLTETKLSHNLKDVKAWYNGYQAGDVIIYNPWSIINCIAENGQLNPYWLNTSDNALVRDLVINSSTSFKDQIEILMQDGPIEKLIDENFVFTSLYANESVVWTLLLMTGYLKVTSSSRMEFGQLCQLAIPNKEVKILYNLIIAQWLSGVNDAAIFNDFLTNLLAGKMENFEYGLQAIMLQTFSVHDVKGPVPEKFFHGFMLGLIAGIDRKQYEISSNKESGLGRYDIALIPKDAAKLGIILELKSLGNLDATADVAVEIALDLKKAANLALQQIDNKQYVATMAQQQIKKCLKIGIAFSGKELAVVHRVDLY